MQQRWVLACLVMACDVEQRVSPDVACDVDVPVSFDLLYGLPPFDFAGKEIAWAGDSSWIVLDIHDKQAVVVSADGRELMRFGREGGGPGEFRAFAGVMAHPDSGFLVAGHGRLSHFSLEGALRDEVTLPGMITSLISWDGVEATASYVDIMRGPVIAVADLVRGTSKELFVPFAIDPELKSDMMPGVANPFVPVGGFGDSIIVVGSAKEYRLARFDLKGNMRGTLGRPELGIQYRDDGEREDLTKQLGEMFKDLPDIKVMVPEVTDMMMEYPKPAFVGAVRFDLGGNLWLTPKVGGDSTEFDILNRGGRYVGSLWLPHTVLSIDFRDDHMAVLFETVGGPHDGQHAIDVYRFKVSDCVVETSTELVP